MKRVTHDPRSHMPGRVAYCGGRTAHLVLSLCCTFHLIDLVGLGQVRYQEFGPVSKRMHSLGMEKENLKTKRQLANQASPGKTTIKTVCCTFRN